MPHIQLVRPEFFEVEKTIQVALVLIIVLQSARLFGETGGVRLKPEVVFDKKSDN